MKSDLSFLIGEMEQRLQFLDSSPAAENLSTIESALHFLTDWITSNGFASTSEEIDFFKNVAPPFFSKLIYFQKRHQLDIQTALSDSTSRKRLFKQCRRKISYFFTANATLIGYYASGASSNDEQYFLRASQPSLPPTDDMALFVDTRICTLATYKIAKMLAYKKWDRYLLGCLDELSEEIKNPKKEQTRGLLQWTASKSAATELVYGLFSSGTFNNGQARLKEIIYAFEQCFQIDLRGYQSAYQELKMRKKSRTAFLADLRQKLEAKMDEEED
ncbi:MAG: RteC domain-containing protein [Agriterribacter sp.]